MARGRPSRSVLFARLDAALLDLNTTHGGLPSVAQAAPIWTAIKHLDAHHSTAIEGNTLVLREVETLLRRGQAVGAKPLKDYLEVQGYGEAASWVYAQARGAGDWQTETLISVTEIRHVHELAMTPVWQVAPHADATPAEGPGCFREHDIHPFSGGMTPPTWPLVPPRLSDWVDLVARLATQLRSPAETPLPDLLARIHVEFEKVHPFIDGNGRTGRLLLNLILVRLGHPPVVVLKSQRAAYLSALQKADDGECGALGEIFARGLLDSINRFILPLVADTESLLPLAALVSPRLSLAALRQAAQRGRLDAYQGNDGVWLATRSAVSAYDESKHRRA